MGRRKLIRAKQKQQASPYANINWEKVAILFQQSNNASSRQTQYPRVKDILKILAAAGSIGLVFAFPGAALGIAGIANLIIGDNSYTNWRTKKMINQLARQNYVKIKENENGSITVRITKKGITRALTYQLEAMVLKKPKTWDRRWRVVIFDIPNKYKKMRDIFRSRIRQLGLYQLQESVYVSPYKCFDEIEFLRELYGVSVTVQYLLVERIENDSFLKEHFNLV